MKLADKLQGVAGPQGAYGAGIRYANRGEYSTAIEAFRKAEESWRTTHPGESTASLVQVAYCRSRLGDLSGARADYVEALKRINATPRAPKMPKEHEIVSQIDWINSKIGQP